MKRQSGISLIEILITIAIIGSAVAVFATLINVIYLNKVGNLYTTAYKLASGELDAIRELPFNDLQNRTDGNFINILYNAGNPHVLGDALVISASSTPLGVAILPYNKMSDFTIEADVKSTPLSNEAGLLLRARDLENYYFFYIKGDQLALIKNINGIKETLYQTFQSFESDTYYNLKATLSGSSISLYLNDALINTTDDLSFSAGYAALASANNEATFDNVELTLGGELYDWDFTDGAG
ncbi:LamG domain-containing protein, partial [Candidatus Parcubacteria bacterium]|nr:LamG domain-containing protein [Candidatus Parcubacteria bacterium]